jgi:cyanophycinase
MSARPYRPIALFTLLLVLAGCSGPLYGPPQGTLYIVGGAASPENYREFIDLAGGPEARIVVVPTAGGAETYDGERVLAEWRERYGAHNVFMLHTTDRAGPDSDSFVRDLRDADAVFFLGGRQWHLVDAYYGTLAHREFERVLERGGVIGGSSAGASIQASFLARGAVEGNTLMIAPEPEHRVGLGFLRNAAVDQHIDRRNRWNDLREIVLEHPRLIGIGISEATAVIVVRDRFRVSGRGQVAVHDYFRRFAYPDTVHYLLLEPGEGFDMRTRRPIPAIR